MGDIHYIRTKVARHEPLEPLTDGERIEDLCAAGEDIEDALDRFREEARRAVEKCRSADAKKLAAHIEQLAAGVIERWRMHLRLASTSDFYTDDNDGGARRDRDN